MEIIAIPLISSAVFSILQVYKKIVQHLAKVPEQYLAKDKQERLQENLIKIIPIIAGVLGLVAGIICHLAFPTIIPTQYLLTAGIIGTASGLSATGCNQIFKQLHKFGITVKDDKGENE